MAGQLNFELVPSSLQLTNVSKTFVGTKALRDVSLTVEPGEIHALVGHNGSGKSTLIKVLSGFHGPDPGASASIGGDPIHLGDHAAAEAAGIRFVHQNLGLIGEMTVAENLGLEHGYIVGRFGQIKWRDERRRARAALQRVGHRIDVDALVSSLSPVERKLVALARALDSTGGTIRFLILDEPTAVMARPEVGRLFSALREITSEGVGVLFVSHHLDEVFEICDRVTVLRDGRVEGSFGTADVTTEELVALIAGRSARAGGTTTEMPQASARSGRGAFRVRSLRGASVREFDVDLAPGEIVGIAGTVGSGREAVLPLIFGELPRAGSVELDSRIVPVGRPDLSIEAGLVMLPANRLQQALLTGLSSRENIFVTHAADRKVRVLRRRAEETAAVGWVTMLSVSPSDPEATIDTLSGGNQQKVMMARALELRPSILLLNEPTQGVDVGASQGLLDLIRSCAANGSGVLLASSDDGELAQICDRVLIMHEGRVAVELPRPMLDRETIATAVLGGVSNQ